MPTEQAQRQQPRSKEDEEEGVPFDEAHQRQLFEALDSAPGASLDYLHDLARSAARLAEFVEVFFRRRAAQREAAVAAAALAETQIAELRTAGYSEGELRQAAIDGELEDVTRLLALGLGPDAAAERLADWAPLQYAAQHGNTRVCTALVEHRADVLARDRNGETALMQAAYWGHAETAEELARLEKLVTGGAQQSLAPACVVLGASPVPWDSESSVSIICSAPEFSRSRDQVMVGLFQVCDAFSEHVKFGYDWGGSVTAEAADKNEDRTVYDCCHSLACTVGPGPGQCAVRGRPIRGPVDWRNPKSVAGSQWFPKYKTKVMGAIQAEAQRAGIRWIEMVVINGGAVSQLEKRTMPHIITGAIVDLQKKGMDIGLAGQDRAISVFMRPMEYDEFFPRFHHVGSAETISGGCVDLSDRDLKAGNAKALTWFLTTSAGAALNSLTVDSTGDRDYPWRNGGPKTYTLTASEDKVQLSQKNLGSADVALLTAWLQRPEVSAAAARLSLGSNPRIGDEALVQLLDALKDVSLTSLDITSTGCGVPAASKLAELLSGATKFSDAVADLNISEAIIGDAGALLVEAISASSSLEFITIGKGLRLPLKDNYDSDILDAAEKGIEAGGATVIAWWLTTDAAAALNSLRCGNNPGMVGELDEDSDLETPYAHAEVFKQLTDSLKTSQVTDVDFSSCGIGAVALGHLSDWVRDATAAVDTVILKHNMITGSKQVYEGGMVVWKYDVDLSGLIALCEALPSLQKPISLDVSSCGLSVKGVTEIAKAVSAGAAVYEVNISMNDIGVDGAKALGDVISGSSLKCLIIGPKGTRLLVNDADVTELNFEGQEFSPVEVTLVATATSTLAALTNIALDESSIGGLDRWGKGEENQELLTLTDALANSNVTTLSLKACGLGPAACADALLRLLDSVRLTDLNISDNCLTGATRGDYSQPWDTDIDKNAEGWSKLCEKLKSSKLVTLSLERTGLGPVALRTLATSLPAVLNSLRCGNNPGMVGELDKYARLKTPDAHAEVFKQLTDSLKTSQVTDVDFSSCGIGAAALGHLSDWVRDATAAVYEVNISMNPIGVDGAKALGDVISGSSLKCLIIGPKSTRLPVNDADVTELNFEGQEFSPVEMTLVAAVTSTLAAIEALAIGANPIGTEGGNILIEAIQSSCLKTIDIGKPLPLQGKYESDTADLADSDMGPGLALIFAWWLTTDAAAAQVEVVILDGNPIGLPLQVSIQEGGTNVARGTQDSSWTSWDSDWEGTGRERFKDESTGEFWIAQAAGHFIAGSATASMIEKFVTFDFSHIQALGEALSAAKVKTISLADTKFNSATLTEFVKSVRWETAAIVSVNCLANHFGDEGLATLLTAIEGTSVRSLCGLTEGQTVADFSGQGLGPIDCKIMKAEFDFCGFIAALNSIMLDECLLTGTKIKNKGQWNEKIEQLDADLSGFTALCSSVGSSRIVSISLRKCYLGPQALALLTDAIKVMAALNSLTLDSTGDMRNQKTYTLTTGEEKVDLSSKSLGPADCHLLVAWLQQPEVSAAVADLNISKNDIGVDGAKALGDVISGSSLKCLIIGPKGTRLPVNDEEVTELNFEGQEFGHAEVTLVAAATPTLAALNSIMLDECLLTGTKIKNKGQWNEKIEQLDADLSGFTALCSSLGSSQIVSISLRKCYLGPQALTLLTDAIKVMAGLTKVDVRGNEGLDKAAVDALRAAAPETCEILADY
eukprot:COSAG06_NODE_3053_length_5914_cov_126.204643_2_plen_1719_part_00